MLDPDDRFGSAADIGIEPRRELLLLLVGQPAIAADILETGERVFAASCKGFERALEGLRMDVIDGLLTASAF